MNEAHLGHTWDIGLAVLTGYDADGFQVAQTDTEGSEVEGSSSGPDATPVAPKGGGGLYEIIYPGGLVHRPLDPVVDANGNPDGAQAGQVLNLREGGRTFSLHLGDPRITALLPTLEQGGTALYSGCGSFLRMFGSGDDVGRVAIFTTDDGTPNGYSVGIDITPTGITTVLPGGGRKLEDDTGFRWFDASGAHMWLGTQSGVPGFDAAWGVMADSAVIDCEAVQLGRAGLFGRGPAVRADLLQLTFMAPLSAILTQIAAVLTTLAASPAGAAAATPLATLTASLVAFMPLISSTTIAPAQTWASSSVAVA